jgi:hypothetical protein
MRSRTSWFLLLLGICTVGILSRVFQTGVAILDKYLGDALYAAMVYTILRLFFRSRSVIVPAAAVMLAIETFQLTGIAAGMAGSGCWIVRVCAALMGTHFSFKDLLAYAVGIACICLVDNSPTAEPQN